ncbi:plastocyanin/azurin family copper-binding protein [Pontibacter pamirensis]|uniref:plastocyanin/azurin family copper-binding protein n=1 Tax=Pontibacter pamirensis TaxID=2562824 RepID=UPI00138A3FBC|nr:plastocyanin/azurin family copper-binding protein [Pontibacter pamirensis]
MKRYFLNGSLVCCCFLLWNCNPVDSTSEDAASSEELTAEGAVDSAIAYVVEEQDTTLQPVQEITLHAIGNTLEEIAYKEDTLEVKAEVLVNLTFINEGVDMPMMHNVVFTAPGMYKQVAMAAAEVGASGNYVPESPAVIAASPMALPGQTVMLEFISPSIPGAYQYVCTYPDHWHRMHGVLLVK